MAEQPSNSTAPPAPVTYATGAVSATSDIPESRTTFTDTLTMRRLGDFFGGFGLPSPLTPLALWACIKSNALYYSDNYIAIILICAVVHAMESPRFLMWMIVLGVGWNWTLKLNSRNEPTYFGEFMFGNTHRFYFMLWLTLLTVWYFDRGVLLKIFTVGAGISLLHAAARREHTQWEGCSSGAYAPVPVDVAVGGGHGGADP